MKTKTLWRLHSWLGLFAGVPLLLIACSGSVLVFKDEINALLRPAEVRVEPLESGRKSYDALYQSAANELTRHEIVGWAIYPDPARADFLYVMKHGGEEFLSATLDPYTGGLLQEPRALDEGAMGWLLALHFQLLAGRVGEAVTGVLALLLCLLGASGFLVYRRFWKHFLTLRWRTGWRSLAGQLHKRVGVLSSPVFLLLGLTGAYWNIAHTVEEIANPHEPLAEGARHGGHLAPEVSLDRVVADSEARVPGYSANYISLPFHPGEPIRIFGDYIDQGPLRSPYHTVVHYDSTTGEHLETARIEDASAWRQTVDSFEPLHFGTFGGLPVRILWCVVGSAPGFLAISGTFIWWKRRRRG
jgi:uncharacterized iron-regulated membrane protein